jgi:branched-chain amino acid transport system substrate-binding protein
MFRRPALIAVCLALALAGLLPTGAGTRAADRGPIRIGVMLSMTGAGAAYGQMEWIGINLARKMVSRVLGRPIKLFLVDTRSEKIEAANAANRLIKKNRVVAIIGPTISSTSLAAAPIAEKARVPMVSPSATNPLVTQNRKYAFRTCFIDPFQGIVAARYAYQVLGKRRAAIIIDIAQDYSVGLAKFFEAEFKRPSASPGIRISTPSSAPSSPRSRTCCICPTTTPRTP